MRRTLLLLGAVFAVGALGAFAYTLAQPTVETRPSDEPLKEWLDLTDDQARRIREADPTFDAEASALSETLAATRASLAALLDRASATDAEILAQVETVIAAHDALERRVARHVLAIRPHLSPAGQKRLMGLCADGVRRSMVKGSRGGAPEAPPGRDGPGYRGGRGS